MVFLVVPGATKSQVCQVVFMASEAISYHAACCFYFPLSLATSCLRIICIIYIYMICIIHAYFNHTFVYVHKCECHHWQAVDSKVFTVYFLRFEPLHIPDRQVLVVA